MKKPILILLLISILLISGCVTQQTTKQEQTNQEKAIVTKVIDGDTIIIQGGYTVRLLGIDTPEKGEPYYKEAKNYLEERILMKEVYLEKDREDKDQYDRLLRWVWLDGSLINLEQIKQGFAISRLYDSDKYQQEIRRAENVAIQNRIGLWSRLGQNQTIKNISNSSTNNNSTSNNVTDNSCIALGCPQGTQYVASKNSNKFHKCSCSFAKKIKPENLLCFRTREEALDKGYSPCGSCKP
ncbi:MAG: thermonuclease family protein [Candidatus Pacearchaeota archaeon]